MSQNNESYFKGKRYELKLLWRLIKLGWFTIRAPASGGGSSKLIYPDLVAYKDGKIIGIEVKVRLDGRDVYLPIERFRKLKWLEETFGILMYVCAYFKESEDCRCLALLEPSYQTKRYAVYKVEDFEKKGLTPDKL